MVTRSHARSASNLGVLATVTVLVHACRGWMSVVADHVTADGLKERNPVPRATADLHDRLGKAGNGGDGFGRWDAPSELVNERSTAQERCHRNGVVLVTPVLIPFVRPGKHARLDSAQVLDRVIRWERNGQHGEPRQAKVALIDCQASREYRRERAGSIGIDVSDSKSAIREP